MTRVLLAAALLAAAACTPDPERRFAGTVGEVRQALQRGEFAAAQQIAERGLAAAPEDSPWAWTFRLYRAESLILQYRTAEAKPALSAAIPPGPAFDSQRARQKYLAATVQNSEGEPKLALATLAEAGKIAAGSDVELEIAWLEGQTWLRLGQFETAEQKLNALVRQAQTRGDRFIEGRGLNDLGLGRMRRGLWDEAVARFERVLSLPGLEQTTVFAGARLNAGACYGRLGEFDRGLKVLQQALDFYPSRGRRLDYANALGEVGNIYVQRGEPEAALPYYQKALGVASEHRLPTDLWVGNLAAAQIELQRWDDAERSNDEAKRLRAADHNPNIVYNNLNAAQIARGRGRLDDATRLFKAVLDDGSKRLDVRWAAHAGLAEVARAGSDARNAKAHFEQALATIEQAREDVLRTEFRFTFLTRLITFYQSYVDALVEQGQIERALEIADSSRGRVLATRTNWAAPPSAAMTAAAARRVAAQSRAVILSYWLGRDRSYLWIVRGDGVNVVRLPAAVHIARLVRQYNAIIGDPRGDPLAPGRNAGDELYDTLIKPAAAWLPHDARVILVADGALHALNFETLPVQASTRDYWIKDVVLQTAPALSLLSAPRSGTAAPRSVLLIGDPVSPSPEFPPLKYAGAEIATVAKHFPAEAVVRFTSAQASPAAYKKATPGRFSFVHFAAHAATNLESPLDSAVILSGPSDAFKLYARDVADIPLGAELVTVSACRSAGERVYSGEGLVGFAWAFLHAGASRVIAGLWDVDDRSTATVMDDLYTGLAAGSSPADALRAAKLALLAKGGNFQKPYYWGPFQIFTVVP